MCVGLPPMPAARAPGFGLLPKSPGFRRCPRPICRSSSGPGNNSAETASRGHGRLRAVKFGYSVGETSSSSARQNP